MAWPPLLPSCFDSVSTCTLVRRGCGHRPSVHACQEWSGIQQGHCHFRGVLCILGADMGDPGLVLASFTWAEGPVPRLWPGVCSAEAPWDPKIPEYFLESTD